MRKGKGKAGRSTASQLTNKHEAPKEAAMDNTDTAY